MREKAFENKIKNYIKEHGGYVIKYWGGGIYTESGVPDLLVCYKGKFLGLEVKGDGGRPSELQKYNIKKIQDAGGIGMIVYPKDWDKLIEVLESV